jgi:hypothetical protein
MTEMRSPKEVVNNPLVGRNKIRGPKAQNPDERHYTLVGVKADSKFKVREYLESEATADLNVSGPATLAEYPPKIDLVVGVGTRITDTNPVK